MNIDPPSVSLSIEAMEEVRRIRRLRTRGGLVGLGLASVPPLLAAARVLPFAWLTYANLFLLWVPITIFLIVGEDAAKRRLAKALERLERFSTAEIAEETIHELRSVMRWRGSSLTDAESPLLRAVAHALHARSIEGQGVSPAASDNLTWLLEQLYLTVYADHDSAVLFVQAAMVSLSRSKLEARSRSRLRALSLSRPSTSELRAILKEGATEVLSGTLLPANGRFSRRLRAQEERAQVDQRNA